MLGGNVVVLDEGRILQTGPTPDVYHNPTTTKVAEVFSDPPINYLTCTVQGQTACLGEEIELPLIEHMQALSAGNYIFGVRSNHLFLTRTNSDDTEIRTKVELAEINGSETFIHVNYDGSKLVVQEDGIHPHRIGSEISIYVNPCCFFAFDEKGTLVASPSRITIEKRLK
jgi:glycerol transport system ATP-binding protein